MPAAEPDARATSSRRLFAARAQRDVTPRFTHGAQGTRLSGDAGRRLLAPPRARDGRGGRSAGVDVLPPRSPRFGGEPPDDRAEARRRSPFVGRRARGPARAWALAAGPAVEHGRGGGRGSA